MGGREGGLHTIVITSAPHFGGSLFLRLLTHRIACAQAAFFESEAQLVDRIASGNAHLPLVCLVAALHNVSSSQYRNDTNCVVHLQQACAPAEIARCESTLVVSFFSSDPPQKVLVEVTPESEEHGRLRNELKMLTAAERRALESGGRRCGGALRRGR